MRITADLIPHSQFHKGIWLQSAEKADWYYFMKKQNPNTILSKAFIKSVDKPLKELVSYLHRKNIKTTPSCSGHHISERNLEKIFNSLQEDADKIRSDGLKLKDIQTGELYFFINKNYSLPWPKEYFIEKLTLYQRKGVLGMRLGNRKKAKEQILKICIKGVRMRERDSIVFIFTNENLKGYSNNTWKEITKQVKNILN